MCGIIGYIGAEQCIPILIHGLYKMEYRGYDSAGIAYYENSTIKSVKDKGKVLQLDLLIQQQKYTSSHLGIGHTRWATHGEVSQRNAHPHTDKHGHIAIVHNGIIENFTELKAKLLKQGTTFISDTDTEVFVHLLALYYDGDLEKALNKTLQEIQGPYGIVVLSSYEPDKLIAARSGSPLAIGRGKEEHLVASDVMAIYHRTQDVLYLEDNEAAIIYRDHFILKNLKNYQVITRSLFKVDWKVEESDKQGYPHYMLKEIHEQSNSYTNAIRGRLSPKDGQVILSSLKEIHSFLLEVERIVILGMGSSLHASMYGKYIIEDLARIPVDVENAAQFRYRNPILTKKTLVIVVSQSGETADTLGALKEAKLKGIRTLALCNVIGSSIARVSDGGCYLHAGPEIGVASTKVFTSELTLFILIGFYLARMRCLSAEMAERMIGELECMPALIEDTIQSSFQQVQQLAKSLADIRHAFYLGRGYHFPIALEGALKLKEVAYVHAEGYHASELKHGPIALLDQSMLVVVIALQDHSYAKILSNIQEVKARKAQLLIVTNNENTTIQEYTDKLFYIPQAAEYLSPILSVIPLQLLAYSIAVCNNLDVDQPRNLAKSVTVE